MKNVNYDPLIEEVDRLKLLLRDQPQVKDETRTLRPAVGSLKPNARRLATALIQRMRELDEDLVRAKAAAQKLHKELVLDQQRQEILWQELDRENKKNERT